MEDGIVDKFRRKFRRSACVMIDIAICILPKINPDAPTVGPAVLKSHLTANGFSCKVLDFNIDLYRHLEKDNTHEYYYFENDHIFDMRNTDDFSSEFESFYNRYTDCFADWIDQLKELSPKYVGLSLLSSYSLAVALKLCQLIRKELPDSLIVFGGAQISGSTKHIKAKNLIDYYIIGDAEFSLVELLKGNTTYPGINVRNQLQVADLNAVMLPDYDDMNWDKYASIEEENPIYITGSRGCVKRCTFCNVYELWPDYKFRSAESIIEEIKYVRKRYGRTTFKFTDSLINGSMKAFRKLLQYLKEYRQEDPELKWTSQWIIRSKSQSPESDYQLLAESGCVSLEIGVESFSQSVRYHMGKKFTDEDMWWCFDMLQKYKIPHQFLMIVGYPTETADDHQHSINTIKEMHNRGYLHSLANDGAFIVSLNFPNTLMLHQDMPLWDLVKDDIKNYKNVLDWEYHDNTLDVRISRLNELNKLVKDLKKVEKLGWIADRNIANYNKKQSI